MAGRPPMYETPELMQIAIDEYFANDQIKPTISGLAYHLGFESRQSFYAYEDKEPFSYTIKRARARIEILYEERLTDNNVAGSIFALKNLGWKDKTEVENSGTMNFVWNEITNYGTEPEAEPGT